MDVRQKLCRFIDLQLGLVVLYSEAAPLDVVNGSPLGQAEHSIGFPMLALRVVKHTVVRRTFSRLYLDDVHDCLSEDL